MAVHLDDPKALIGAPVTVTGGTELGVVENIYVDEHTGRLEWAAVHTGRWGSDVSLVPLATAAYEAGTLHLPYDPAQVSSGPHWPPGRALTAADERQLYEHYGIASSGHLTVAQPGLDPAHGPAGPADQDRPSTPESPARTRTPAPRGRAHPHPGGTAGGDPPNGTAGAETIRSEEELRASTETVVTGTVRLRKHVVTEYRTITVAVSHDEVTLEQIPATGDPDQDAASYEAAQPADQHTPGAEHRPGERQYMTLYAEEPVITVERVAKERVWIGITTVPGHQQVSAQVRKEHLDTEIGQHI